MKPILGLKNIQLKIDTSNGYYIKELEVDVNINGKNSGFVSLVVVKEPNDMLDDDTPNLDDYLDQYRFEESCLIPSPYDSLIDLEYGESIEPGDLVIINTLFLNKKFRGQGYGSRILAEIIDYANFLGINRIALSPQPIGIRRKEEMYNKKVLSLESWYKKYGFNTYLNDCDGYKYMLFESRNAS